MSPGAVELQSVSKAHGAGSGRHPVLSDISLTLEEGEFVAVLGFSGCGKTTLVSIIAGLTQPDGGRVLAGGQPITGPGSDRGVVFQNYSLLPWMTVRENVALAIDSAVPDLPSRERRARVTASLELVNLGAAAAKKPRQLSGGMRQRVAVARALVLEPRILLLDEPLSALDALTRASLQDEIERIRGRQGRTILMITNDVDEGLLLADRILVLTPGPGATIGREFPVALARPRHRRDLNHDPAFKRLRGEILQYLMEINPSARRRTAFAPAEGPATAALPAVAKSGLAL